MSKTFRNQPEKERGRDDNILSDIRPGMTFTLCGITMVVTKVNKRHVVLRPKDWSQASEQLSYSMEKPIHYHSPERPFCPMSGLL